MKRSIGLERAYVKGRAPTNAPRPPDRKMHRTEGQRTQETEHRNRANAGRSTNDISKRREQDTKRQQTPEPQHRNDTHTQNTEQRQPANTGTRQRSPANTGHTTRKANERGTQNKGGSQRTRKQEQPKPANAKKQSTLIVQSEALGA